MIHINNVRSTVLMKEINNLPKIVALGSEFVLSDLSEGLFPFDVSVEAPEDNGFSVTHSSPSTLNSYISINVGQSKYTILLASKSVSPSLSSIWIWDTFLPMRNYTTFYNTL